MDAPIRLKIVSDGPFQTTRVIDVETGRAVRGVVAVSWSIDRENAFGTATFTVFNVPVEIETLTPASVVARAGPSRLF